MLRFRYIQQHLALCPELVAIAELQNVGRENAVVLGLDHGLKRKHKSRSVVERHIVVSGQGLGGLSGKVRGDAVGGKPEQHQLPRLLVEPQFSAVRGRYPLIVGGQPPDGIGLFGDAVTEGPCRTLTELLGSDKSKGRLIGRIENSSQITAELTRGPES